MFAELANGVLAGLGYAFFPYYAWGAALSPGFHHRVRVTSYRAWAGVAAKVTSKATPWLIGVLFGYAGIPANLEVLSVMRLKLIPVTVGLAVLKVPESGNYMPARVPLLPGLPMMWRNAPFKCLVAACTGLCGGAFRVLRLAGPKAAVRLRPSQRLRRLRPDRLELSPELCGAPENSRPAGGATRPKPCIIKP